MGFYERKRQSTDTYVSHIKYCFPSYIIKRTNLDDLGTNAFPCALSTHPTCKHSGPSPCTALTHQPSYKSKDYTLR